MSGYCPANVLFLEHSTKSPRAALTTGDVTHGGMSMSVSHSSTLISAACDPETLPEKLRQFVIDPDTGCWLWVGELTNGYGRVVWAGRFCGAHRAMYLHLNGNIPSEVHVHHACLRTDCVNPAHLVAMPRDVHRLEHSSPVRPNPTKRNSMCNWHNKAKVAAVKNRGRARSES